MTQVRLWGTRGSLATPGVDTQRYGGNTSCVEVRGEDGTVLVLDAGTGIRRLGATLADSTHRVDLLLTHLHMDHIQGLGFFAPLFQEEREVHIWGPASTTLSLRERLSRYLSPPLFPVHLRDVPSRLQLHEVPCCDVEIGRFRVASALVCHPNPTVGYRITSPHGTVTYLPDHEPSLGLRRLHVDGSWTSGFSLAVSADLLIHDAQYTDAEYAERIGWGHSSVRQAFAFASLAQVRHLVAFHHDPSHSDADVDRIIGHTIALTRPPFEVTPAAEGATFNLSG